MSTTNKYIRGHTDLERYEQEVRDHNEFCRVTEMAYKYAGVLAVKHFGSTQQVVDFENALKAELRRKQSMDAPNKPGYYRANND